MAISPGVYSKIIPLESYVQEVPASTGFIVAITPKGPDNKLTFIGSLKELDQTFGKPNLAKYGKYSHAHYIARNFATINPALYMIRVLPKDATYANLTTFIFVEKPDYVDPNTGKEVHSSFPVRYITTPVDGIKSLNTNFTPPKYPELYVIKGGGSIYKAVITSNADGTKSINFEPVRTGISPNYAKRFISVFDKATNSYVVYDFQTETVDSEKQPVYKDYYFKLDDKLYALAYDSQTNTFSLEEVGENGSFMNVPYNHIDVLYSFIGEGRGEWYNNLAVGYDIFENRTDYFILNTYEKVDETTIVQTNSFNVSFNPEAVDDAFNSIYIKEVLDKFAKDIDILIDEEKYVPNTNMSAQLIKEFVKTLGYDPRTPEKIVRFVDIIAHSDDEILQSGLDSGIAFIANKAGGTINEYQGMIVRFVVESHNLFITETINNVDFGDVIGVKKGNDVELYIHADNGVLYKFDPYLHSLLQNEKLIDKVFLGYGSDGSLINAYGTVEAGIADRLIASAFTGAIDKDVINTETIWFDLVFDAGYPREVKNQIVKLTNDIRRDCIAIIDNGDNIDADSAIKRRNTEHYYNSEYAALYEPYIKVYDPITGKNIWITPVYSVAKLIALNDKINEVWYAVAGFRRGSDSEILETRYSPTLSERDQFYLNQINPIVTFKEGKVLWGQLTTRRIADPLQDLNIMRLILYVKRAIEQFSKYELFEFNDVVTWQRIENAIKAFLQDVKDRRGLYDFKVSVYATEYQKQRKAASVDIMLYPTRALERIYLNFFIK